MFRSFFIGCFVLVGAVAAGVATLNLSPEDEVASQGAEPTAINAQKATIVAPGEEIGPLEKAGRVADDLIEKAGLGSGNVEQITETAKQIGEKAAEKAGVVVEKAGLGSGSVEQITETAKQIGEKAAEKAGVVVEKAGLNSGSVEQITETAKQIGEKAAEKAGVVVEKVKETANRAIVRAEELAEDGKDAALEAADDLGDTINTGK